MKAKTYFEAQGQSMASRGLNYVPNRNLPAWARRFQMWGFIFQVNHNHKLVAQQASKNGQPRNQL